MANNDTTSYKVVIQEAIPADGHPGHGCEHGKRTDHRRDPHWAPVGILWVNPPAQHTS